MFNVYSRCNIIYMYLYLPSKNQKILRDNLAN